MKNARFAMLFNPLSWAKELIAESSSAFDAGRELETKYGYSPFLCTEKWKDSFEGWSLIPLMQ